MTTILHVASSSNTQTSNSRQVGHVLMEGFRQTYPGAQLIERDLMQTPVSHITPEQLAAMFSGNADAPELALSDRLVGEVLASDILVIEVPMYNFGIPSALKAWIDNIVRAGKTFAYTATGPQGLAKGKKAILILTSGGIYSEGPAKGLEHQESYMRTILGFIGITDVEAITMEGTKQFPDKAATIVAAAKEKAVMLSHRAA